MSAPRNGGLKREESFQWPSGHVGHLSPGQVRALDRFKSLCEEKGYYGRGDGKIRASHDDETLLRYLRARKFVPQEGFGQFKDTEDWRQMNELDKLFETIDIVDFDRARKLYPQWTGRRDRRGIPFYVFEVGRLEYKDVEAFANDKDRKKSIDGPPIAGKAPGKMLRLFALYESMLRFVLPLCSLIPTRPNAETPISQSSNIVDMQGVGFKQLWNLRAHMQDASKLATAHYPETLDRIFVVGAPSYFPTIWGWAKKWFDPITVSKIFILSDANTLSTLQKYVDIENIPKKYGGKLDWSFGEMPALEPEIADALAWEKDYRHKGHRTLPIGPIKLEYNAAGDLAIIAIGTEDGKPRHEVIAGIHPDGSVAQLALNPGRAEDSAIPTPAIARAPASPSPIAAATDKALVNDSKTSPASSDSTAAQRSDSAVLNTTAASTYKVPSETAQPTTAMASPHPDARQGTSNTRFEQQSDTHAEGQLGHGTPEVRQDGQGTQHSVMEPRTVGQAPKDTPLYRDEDGKPTMVEQAQQLATQAYEQAAALPATVMNAVGMGEKKETGEEVVHEDKIADKSMDGLQNHQVEEFLRAQTTTREDSAQDVEAKK